MHSSYFLCFLPSQPIALCNILYADARGVSFPRRCNRSSLIFNAFHFSFTENLNSANKYHTNGIMIMKSHTQI